MTLVALAVFGGIKGAYRNARPPGRVANERHRRAGSRGSLFCRPPVLRSALDAFRRAWVGPAYVLEPGPRFGAARPVV